MGFGYHQWGFGLLILSMKIELLISLMGTWAFDIANENWALMLPMKIGF